MDYPSTTQALFALIVMIIVLAFIFVYCCWGTFSCPQPREAVSAEGGPEGGQLLGGDSTHSLFILPYRSMIYIGDGQTRQIYQIPLIEDKPPSYRDIFNNLPPPPCYGGSVPLLDTDDEPPTYEDCIRNGDETGVRGRGSTQEETNSSSSCSFYPRLQHSSSSATSTPHYAQGIASSPKLHSSFSSVFRAKSLLTGITSSSSCLPHSSRLPSQRMVPLAVSTVSSNPPFLVSLSGESKQKSLDSFTTSSSPCLPSTYESCSKSNTRPT